MERQRRSGELKRRFAESNDLSALEKVDALEKSMDALRKEMNSKLEFIQEILRAKNAQIDAQKRILDYESTVFKTLVENWDTNSELSKLGFSHLIQGLGDDIGRVLTPNNNNVDDEHDNSASETDLTYEPSGDDRNAEEMDTNYRSSRISRTRRSRRKRKSRATTDDKSKQQSESPLTSKKQRIMNEDDEEHNSDPQPQNRIIKDENIEIIIEDDDFANEMETEIEGSTTSPVRRFKSKKTSEVWNYFELDSNKVDVHCTICRDAGAGENGTIRRGPTSTTTCMRRHLEGVHNLTISNLGNNTSKSQSGAGRATVDKNESTSKSTPSASTASLPITLRKKKIKKRISPAWEYFSRNKSRDQAECLLCKKEGKSKIFNSHKGPIKLSSTLINHLSREHKILLNSDNPEPNPYSSTVHSESDSDEDSSEAEKE